MSSLENDIRAALDLARNELYPMPDGIREGFLSIIEYMGVFSGSFAAGASRASSIRERINSQDAFGLAPLRHELRRLSRESKGVFDAFANLMVRNQEFSQTLARVTEWSFSLEQEAHLPSVAEQVRLRGGEWLEIQTMSSIIDNLMQQIRPLIHEMGANSQQAEDVIKHLARRLAADLENSRHSLNIFKRNSDRILARMTDDCRNMDTILDGIEERAGVTGESVFAMMQSLQFDDITTQRIQHSIDAVQLMQTKLTTMDSDPAMRRWMYLATRIVVDQLEETSTDLVTAVQSVHHHLTAIADQAVAQAQSVVGLRRIGMDIRQSTADLAHHLSGLLRLGIFDVGIANEILKSISQAENAVFQTKRIVNVLVVTAKRMENLAISVKFHGNDRLEIVLASTIDLARRIQKEAPVVLHDLQAAASILHLLGMDYAEQTTPRLVMTNSLLRRIPLSNQQIETNHADLAGANNDTLADAQTVNIQILLLTAEMTFHMTGKKVVERIVQNLGRIIERTGVAGDADLGGDINQMAAEFEDLANLYTMASERRVHQAALTEENDGDESSGADDFELF